MAEGRGRLAIADKRSIYGWPDKVGRLFDAPEGEIGYQLDMTANRSLGKFYAVILNAVFSDVGKAAMACLQGVKNDDGVNALAHFFSPLYFFYIIITRFWQ